VEAELAAADQSESDYMISSCSIIEKWEKQLTVHDDVVPLPEELLVHEV
jgi:hypothetical protein